MLNRYRTIRLVLTFSVLIATITVFIRYFITHPAVRLQLSRTSWLTLLGLFVLFIAMLGSLALINSATLRICRTTIARRESVLLTAYSGLINFFGPLQSGPAFRAVYLKKKHGLVLKDYTTVTLLYYLFYAFFSGGCLLFGWLQWWALAITVIFLALSGGIVWRYRQAPRLAALDVTSWYLLALATFIQVGVFVLIYYLELRSLHVGAHFSQAVVYTGAANLALFVSFTPGAIGFRESFLVFSEHLHHLSNSTIVAANILDRASYIFVLLVIAIVLFGGHLRQELDTSSPDV